MALPSETSDTRQQFTWSHCYDMTDEFSSNYTPYHAGVTSKTMCERQSCSQCGNKAADGALYASHTPCPSRRQIPGHPTHHRLRVKNPPPPNEMSKLASR